VPGARAKEGGRWAAARVNTSGRRAAPPPAHSRCPSHDQSRRPGGLAPTPPPPHTPLMEPLLGRGAAGPSASALRARHVAYAMIAACVRADRGVRVEKSPFCPPRLPISRAPPTPASPYLLRSSLQPSALR
jgi:hypothetical protein